MIFWLQLALALAIILLCFVSFLFTIRKTRISVAQTGAGYISAVYVVYFLIGLGLLQVSTLLKAHWPGQAGAALLVLLGLTNLLGAIFPNFPIRLEVPEGSKGSLQKWMYQATLLLCSSSRWTQCWVADSRPGSGLHPARFEE